MFELMYREPFWLRAALLALFTIVWAFAVKNGPIKTTDAYNILLLLLFVIGVMMAIL